VTWVSARVTALATPKTKGKVAGQVRAETAPSGRPVLRGPPYGAQGARAAAVSYDADMTSRPPGRKYGGTVRFCYPNWGEECSEGGRRLRPGAEGGRGAGGRHAWGAGSPQIDTRSERQSKTALRVADVPQEERLVASVRAIMSESSRCPPWSSCADRRPGSHRVPAAFDAASVICWGG
jgi:hypothetical protein